MSLTYETNPLMRRMTLAFLRVEAATAEPGKPGFPPHIGLAVSACESAWWSAQTGANNYFGITRPPAFDGDPGSAWCATTENITGMQLLSFRADERATAKPIRPGWYSMHRWFAAYPDLKTAVQAYVHLLIDATLYHPAWVAFHNDRAAHGNSDEFLRAVCAAGYATGPAYKVEIQIAHQQNIIHAVSAGRAELLANPAAA